MHKARIYRIIALIGESQNPGISWDSDFLIPNPAFTLNPSDHQQRKRKRLEHAKLREGGSCVYSDVDSSALLVPGVEPPGHEGHELVLPVAFSTAELNCRLTLIDDLEEKFISVTI